MSDDKKDFNVVWIDRYGNIVCSGESGPKNTAAYIEYSAYEKEKQKAQKLVEALRKAHGALGYAYEDSVDKFYANHQDDINKTLAEYETESV